MFNIFTATKKDIPAILDLAEKTWWPAYSPILSPGQIRYMLDTIYGARAISDAMADQSQIFLVLADEKKTIVDEDLVTLVANTPILVSHK